mmetsp:Transcript_10621/g.33626  ORF Transcript_10621/g.33626 Transcript_10621/m.33626 type:complete len:255 (-) Transcript_10621:93-857(-)
MVGARLHYPRRVRCNPRPFEAEAGGVGERRARRLSLLRAADADARPARHLRHRQRHTRAGVGGDCASARLWPARLEPRSGDCDPAAAEPACPGWHRAAHCRSGGGGRIRRGPRRRRLRHRPLAGVGRLLRAAHPPSLRVWRRRPDGAGGRPGGRQRASRPSRPPARLRATGALVALAGRPARGEAPRSRSALERADGSGRDDVGNVVRAAGRRRLDGGARVRDGASLRRADRRAHLARVARSAADRRRGACRLR